jgi:hypothetical protein
VGSGEYLVLKIVIYLEKYEWGSKRQINQLEIEGSQEKYNQETVVLENTSFKG